MFSYELLCGQILQQPKGVKRQLRYEKYWERD